jgi:hypothetical protein
MTKKSVKTLQQQQQQTAQTAAAALVVRPYLATWSFIDTPPVSTKQDVEHLEQQKIVKQFVQGLKLEQKLSSVSSSSSSLKLKLDPNNQLDTIILVVDGREFIETVPLVNFNVPLLGYSVKLLHRTQLKPGVPPIVQKLRKIIDAIRDGFEDDDDDDEQDDDDESDTSSSDDEPAEGKEGKKKSAKSISKSPSPSTTKTTNNTTTNTKILRGNITPSPIVVVTHQDCFFTPAPLPSKGNSDDNNNSNNNHENNSSDSRSEASSDYYYYNELIEKGDPLSEQIKHLLESTCVPKGNCFVVSLATDNHKNKNKNETRKVSSESIHQTQTITTTTSTLDEATVEILEEIRARTIGQVLQKIAEVARNKKMRGTQIVDRMFRDFQSKSKSGEVVSGALTTL